MNKQIILLSGAALLLILLIGCTQPSCGDQQCQVGENDSTSENYCPNDCTNPPTNFDDANLPDVPWSFLSMHVENIDDYDQCFDDLVALADEYNTPLTLLLWPSIAEHIQNDPAKLAKMQGWIANGHEIGIHAQYCCTEGQTDTFECLDDGDAEIYNQLVAPHTIKTVHVAPAIIVEEGDAALGLTGCVERLPESAIYSGVGRYDGRSSISLK